MTSFAKKMQKYLVNSKKSSTFAPAFKKAPGAIAQLVEQRTENPCVPSSILGGTTENDLIRVVFWCPSTRIKLEFLALMGTIIVAQFSILGFYFIIPNPLRRIIRIKTGTIHRSEKMKNGRNQRFQ